jgi:hypothetical protein
MRPSRTLLFTSALLATSLLVACAPLSVHSTTGRNVDFKAYKTYRWADDGPRTTGDPRVDGNPFFEGRLVSAAEKELATRGYEKTDGAADLVLHYHVNFREQFDIADRDASYTRACTDCFVSSVYQAGTIVLDLVDARTNTLVWRSWAEGSMDGAIDNQRFMEERIDAAVKKIVATVPPRL